MSRSSDSAASGSTSSLGGWLRAAYDGAPECPETESWSSLAAGDLPADARRRLLEHSEQCPACASERDLALLFAGENAEAVTARSEDVEAEIAKQLEAAFPFREFPAAGSGDQETGARVRALPRRRLLVTSRWLAAAAVLLVAAGSWQLLRRERTTLPDPFRDDVVRGATLELLAPAGDLLEPPAEFAWAPVEGASSYTVEVRRVDDELVWASRAVASATAVAATGMPELPRGVVFRWSVTATDASGTELVRSRSVSFRILPEAPPNGETGAER